MNKFKYAFLLCIATVATLQLKAQNNVLDEVAWIVGDEPILKSDVEMIRLQAEFERNPIKGDPYTTIPEELAIQKLFLHQAELDSIEVSAAEVEDRVEDHLQRLIEQVGSEEALAEYRNQSIRELRAQLTKS